MLTFQTENWGDVEQELRPLMQAHWEEMPFDAAIPLALDETLYKTLEAMGRLFVLTVRTEDAVVGYFVSFITRHPHYDVLVGSMDVYWLDPLHRSAANGIRFFMEYEKAMRERGVQYLLATARMDREKNAGALFERLGWKCARTVWDKRIS